MTVHAFLSSYGFRTSEQNETGTRRRLIKMTIRYCNSLPQVLFVFRQSPISSDRRLIHKGPRDHPQCYVDSVPHSEGNHSLMQRVQNGGGFRMQQRNWNYTRSPCEHPDKVLTYSLRSQTAYIREHQRDEIGSSVVYTWIISGDLFLTYRDLCGRFRSIFGG